MTLTKFIGTLAKCIDKYISLRVKGYEDGNVQIDSRLQDVVERMFKRCYDDGEFKQVFILEFIIIIIIQFSNLNY